MGLTNSVEEINDSDIKITNEGEYNSWDDITKDLTDEKMDTLMGSVDEESKDTTSEDTTSEKSVDEELRQNVTKFVDEVIEQAVSEYNKMKMAEEDTFFRIPSNDDLYEKSLEKHFENTYEYHDEMRVRESSESEYESSEYEESSEYVEETTRRGCSSAISHLCEACMEFCDEMNGHYDDYSEEEETTLSEYFEDWMNSPDVIELRENIYSLKTSYELVRDRMNQFLNNNREALKTGMYGAFFYYIFFSKGV